MSEQNGAARVGMVTLKVGDLQRMTTFYKDIIGMTVRQREDDRVTLGAGETDLLTLQAAPGSRRVTNTTGLYHFAILVPSRFDLARSIKQLAETQTPLQGMSDHVVSEAIYLADPEGNGIEIYRDRPRSAWYRDGEFQLATLPIDLDGVINELAGKNVEWTGLHDDTVIGHIHLHVSSIPEAEGFYRDLLGCDVMVNIGSATFLSYDGYHHHIGANIWSGHTPPPPDALGLDHYVLDVGGADRLDGILARLDEAGVTVEQEEGGYVVRDPSQNRVLLTA